MGKRRRPTTSGNFFKDVMRVLGFFWKSHKSKKSKGEGKVMKKLKREFNK